MSFTTSYEIASRLVLRFGGDRFNGFIRLYRTWRNVVGDILAEKSHPFRFKNYILYVAVANNTWMQELVLRKKEIVANCQKQSGETVNDIIFLIHT